MSKEGCFSLGRQLHTMSSILPEMEHACRHIEAEMTKLELEMASLIKDIDLAIGEWNNLSSRQSRKPLGADVDI